MNKVSPGSVRKRGCMKPLKYGCGCFGVFILLILALPFVFLNRVPKTYPPATSPIEPPAPASALGGGLEGFASPYLGHTGSWDGKGGGMGGSSKIKSLDTEASMDLRWTFMPVYWKALEPDGPVHLTNDIPPAWEALDRFVIEAHKRKLNILMQAPVMGGNAGGPPTWAGRREKGKSAPANMDAAAGFAGKLAARYSPGGTLASQKGWGTNYGVRAWELDNEPDGYLVHWKNQGADYAEFVTKVSAAIKIADPQALIAAPGTMGGEKASAWVESTLDAHSMQGSPEFRNRAVPYSIGPVVDVVSFHVYEGLNTAFSGRDRTIEVVFSEMQAVFEKWETRAAGFEYSRKQEYWHTEGNFDFLGVLSQKRRAAWRMQFFTRAFAAGIRKVMVMDASRQEQVAVKAYVKALPNPFPMERADSLVESVSGKATAFRHLEGPGGTNGCVWVLWAQAGAGDAEIAIPTVRESVIVIQVDGSEVRTATSQGKAHIMLRGDRKMAPPVLVLDRDDGRTREEKTEGL